MHTIAALDYGAGSAYAATPDFPLLMYSMFNLKSFFSEE